MDFTLHILSRFLLVCFLFSSVSNITFSIEALASCHQMLAVFTVQGVLCACDKNYSHRCALNYSGYFFHLFKRYVPWNSKFAIVRECISLHEVGPFGGDHSR